MLLQDKPPSARAREHTASVALHPHNHCTLEERHTRLHSRTRATQSRLLHRNANNIMHQVFIVLLFFSIAHQSVHFTLSHRQYDLAAKDTGRGKLVPMRQTTASSFLASQMMQIPYSRICFMLSTLHVGGNHIFAEAWAVPYRTSRRFAPGVLSKQNHLTAKPSNLPYIENLNNPANRYSRQIRSHLSRSENSSHESSHIFNNVSQPSSTFKSTHLLDLKILLIDNHDSYTYNLYQYLSTMTTHPVKVIMNDAFSSWDDLMNNFSSDGISPKATSDLFDCVILSPGPGQPACPSDMGIVLDTIRKNSDVPILGVCLGHQALGYFYGNDVNINDGASSLNEKMENENNMQTQKGVEVKLAPCGPVHGLMSSVFWLDNEQNPCEPIDNNTNDVDESSQSLSCQLFRGLPQNFDVVRYHSLVVEFPPSRDDFDIEPIAWCNSQPDETTKSESNSPGSHNDTICMALRHKQFPHYGVQFHPESIGTGEAGYQILWNFCEFAHQYNNQRKQQINMTLLSPSKLGKSLQEGSKDDLTMGSDTATPSLHRVFVHKVENDRVGDSTLLPSPERVFDEIYRSRPNSFWLDSSTGDSCFGRVESNNESNNIDGDGSEGCPITSNSRFSIMGSDDGPLSTKIEYFGREHGLKQRGLRTTSKSGSTRQEDNAEVKDEGMSDVDILSYLRRNLVDEQQFVDRVNLVTFDGKSNGINVNSNSKNPEFTIETVSEFGENNYPVANDKIPFDYRGGYVGYLGYEVRHDTQCWILEQEGFFGCDTNGKVNGRESAEKTNPNIPTAAFMFVDRSLVYDHQTGDWYVIGITKDESSDGFDLDSKSVQGTISWILSIKSTIESMVRIPNPDSTIFLKVNEKDKHSVTFVPNRSKDRYKLDIARSHEEIRNGESYELCVTNQLEAELKLPRISLKGKHESPYELYKLLRKKNPAPFSAYIGFYQDDLSEKGDTKHHAAAVSICCSSPERFLSVNTPQSGTTTCGDSLPSTTRKFTVESKPIKGTAARYTGDDPIEVAKEIDSQIAADLKESVKDKAENLMIVDLLRNDLGRVCEVGSVHVPKLMQIETYATVHQMVSTVRGTLDGDTTNSIDVIEACFPGGSMTGAPKQRTMEILDEIEQGVSRGPYSGCLGYISLNGCMDMNIVIRSAVLTPMSSDDENVEAWKVSIGCGGAITALSNSDDEYEEMLLKSKAVRGAISEWVEQARKLNRDTKSTNMS